MCYTKRAIIIIITIFFENTLKFATPLFGDLRILLRVALPLFIVRKKMRKIVMVVFVFNLRIYTNCGTYNVQLINNNNHGIVF